MLEIPLTSLDPDLPPPARMRPGDAAFDLPARADGTIAAGARALVDTGFALAVPVGHAGLILPRSGLALNHGVTVLNGPGLIDAGYRGEIKVILLNTGGDAFVYERGQRIAQLLVLPIPELTLAVVDQLPPAPDDRGASGFGSSG